MLCRGESDRDGEAPEWGHGLPDKFARVSPVGAHLAIDEDALIADFPAQFVPLMDRFARDAETDGYRAGAGHAMRYGADWGEVEREVASACDTVRGFASGCEIDRERAITDHDDALVLSLAGNIKPDRKRACASNTVRGGAGNGKAYVKCTGAGYAGGRLLETEISRIASRG